MPPSIAQARTPTVDPRIATMDAVPNRSVLGWGKTKVIVTKRWAGRISKQRHQSRPRAERLPIGWGVTWAQPLALSFPSSSIVKFCRHHNPPLLPLFFCSSYLQASKSVFADQIALCDRACLVAWSSAVLVPGNRWEEIPLCAPFFRPTSSSIHTRHSLFASARARRPAPSVP